MRARQDVTYMPKQCTHGPVACVKHAVYTYTKSVPRQAPSSRGVYLRRILQAKAGDHSDQRYMCGTVTLSASTEHAWAAGRRFKVASGSNRNDRTTKPLSAHTTPSYVLCVSAFPPPGGAVDARPGRDRLT